MKRVLGKFKEVYDVKQSKDGYEYYEEDKH